MTIGEFCVRRPVFAVMLISFLLVLGIFSFRDLGVDLFPKADAAVVTVNVSLKGATPEEVNSQIVVPMEEALSNISGLDEVSSWAMEGSTRIICRFLLERDLNGGAQDVRERVASAMHLLPPEVDPPVIVKQDPDAEPVVTLLVAGGGNFLETTEIADKQVMRALETVRGVGTVTLSGGRQRQIRVYADAEKLSAYGITISQVERAIENENVEVPGGTMRRDASELGIRTLGRIESPKQFNDISVANVNGAPIRIRDLGRVEDSWPDVISWNLFHGKEAVVLSVQRQFGANTLEVIEGVKAKLEEIKATLPPGISTEMIRDNSIYINASIHSLEEHLLFGALLASLVVLLFLGNLRSVLIAAVAIPTSVIATFTLLRIMDFTLNSMTLLGLTLAVGIVIDDAIVVLENIVRYIEEKHFTPWQAAIQATEEIMFAVVATTLSLVILFVPIAFTTGTARRYLSEFGWTMAFAVMVSMLVSFTLIPMLCSRFLKPSTRASGDAADGAQPRISKPSALFGRVERAYGKMLGWSLQHRWVVILIALGAFALTIPLNKLVGRDFIPPDDQSEFQVIVDVPVDSSMQLTSEMATEISQRIEKVPGVLFTWAGIGNSVTGRNTQANVYVRLVDVSKRNFAYTDVAANIRKIMAEPRYREFYYKIWYPSVLGNAANSGGLGPLILGPDFTKAILLAQQAAERLRKVNGIVDVIPVLNLNSPELQVHVDRQRAADLGVRISDVANAVRLMIAGTDQITTYKEGAEQYDVTMQLLPEQQKNPAVLSRLMIPSNKLGQVRLDNIATIQRGFGPLRVDRYARMYEASMVANAQPGFPMDAAVRATRAVFAKILPQGYNLRFNGVAKDLDRATGDLITAFLLACIFMYMVLATQFNSFLDPFVIMLALPLSVPFALLTLYLTHRTLNLWSSLGMLLLLGIVKKNGILQVDYTNRLRAEGVPLREAILQANHVRLRPILMTTLSIVAGLIPTASGIGSGGSQRAAIAVTIIGGQSLCLLLTLLVTPVAYSLFAELNEKRAAAQMRWSLGRLRLDMARLFLWLPR